MEQKSSSLLQLESIKLQTSKKLALLENDVSQLKMRENLYKESISSLKAELEEERRRRDEEGRKWRDLIEEGEERLMREKARLEDEIRKYKEDEVKYEGEIGYLFLVLFYSNITMQNRLLFFFSLQLKTGRGDKKWNSARKI